MRILIVGNGGREHALLWKLQKDAPTAEFFVTRPNGGQTPVAETVDLGPSDTEGLIDFARRIAVDLTVVGPEAPLAEGIVDRFEAEGLKIFGPVAGAARIESSKAFAKQLMVEADVPTADYRTFDRLEPALAHIDEVGAPVVVKASGLAAGKGAIVCQTLEEARDAARAMLSDELYGDAGSQIVVEAFMEGEELSVFALCDGSRALCMMPSQDHKRIGEGDAGPNTGGMGAYAPVSIATDGLLDRIQEEILGPTLKALAAAGSRFRGLLYAGIMVTEEGPKIVEYNCRFGDPETQVVLPLMESSLLDVLMDVAEGGSLADANVHWAPMAAVTTVLASGGYPGSYETGIPVEIPGLLESDPHLIAFHAGTRLDKDGLVTSGGRVMAMTGIGRTMAEASTRSRRGAMAVSFDGKYYRNDIGWRELAREKDGE